MCARGADTGSGCRGAAPPAPCAARPLRPHPHPPTDTCSFRYASSSQAAAIRRPAPLEPRRASVAPPTTAPPFVAQQAIGGGDSAAPLAVHGDFGAAVVTHILSIVHNPVLQVGHGVLNYQWHTNQLYYGPGVRVRRGLLCIINSPCTVGDRDQPCRGAQGGESCRE